MLRIPQRTRAAGGWWPLLSVLLAAAGCSGDSPTRTEDPAPVITVAGVEDGAVYTDPVTFSVSVDRGSYTATLNGTAVLGAQHTASDPGDYELLVSARNGEATAERRISFSIELGAAGETTLVRVLDLGPNEAGGGGDAILVTDSAGGRAFHALIDAGPAGPEGSDEGYVLRRLQALGVDTLETLVLTHAHSDHFGGMDEVLRDVHVRRFVYNGQRRSLSFYQTVLQLAESRADTMIVPDTVHRFRLAPSDEGTELVVLPPLETFLDSDTDSGDELNEGSVGVLVQRGGESGFQMFLTGDGEVEANRRWRTTFPALTGDVEVLKVGHHGANNAVFDNGFSGSSAWLEHTAPEAVVISANGVTHARTNALSFLQSIAGLELYCTNVHGELLVRARADGLFAVEVEGDPAEPCRAGTEANTDIAPVLW